MAVSIRKRKNSKGRTMWTFTVRRAGECLSMTFINKNDGTAWSQRVENAIRSSVGNPDKPFNREDFLEKKRPDSQKVLNDIRKKLEESKEPNVEWTLKTSIQHFINTKLDDFKSYDETLNKLKTWMKDPISNIKLKELSPEVLYDWVNSRIKEKKSPSTIKNNIYLISTIYRTASSPVTRGGWGLLELDNPVKHIELPKNRPNRQRRLFSGEEERLFTELSKSSNPEIIPFIRMSLETGMRKSEILNTTIGEIHITPKGWSIDKHVTKNGNRRIIYLSQKCVDVIKPIYELKKNNPLSSRLFSISDNQVEVEFSKSRDKIGSTDLRLHDLRHEAISRLADKGLSIGAISSQSGHRNAQTLLRYVNVSENDIRTKLEQKLRG